jgi:hypothetical protein
MDQRLTIQMINREERDQIVIKLFKMLNDSLNIRLKTLMGIQRIKKK